MRKLLVKRIVSIVLALSLVISLIFINSINAYALNIPERARPTKETVWSSRHIKNSFDLGYSWSVNITGLHGVTTVGYNQNGELGNGTKEESLEFVDVLGEDGIGFLTDVVAVSAGRYHTLVLKEDGTVWAWGLNGHGQLGDGTTTNRTTPVQVKGLTDVVSIAAGHDHSLALKEDGTVWAWGSNEYGKLGDNSTTTTQRLTPVQVKNLTDVVSISTVQYHSLALKSDGTVWAWGYNAYGRLGDNSTSDRRTPVQVKGLGGSGYLTDVVAISAGYAHSLALKSDGTVWAWGYNGSGRLGDNSTTDRRTPVQVKGLGGSGYLENIVNVYAGWGSSLALKSDGTVWAWGHNGNGQLGDGTTSNRTTPVQVKGPDGSGYLTDIVAIKNKYDGVFALKSDGTMWAWGHNRNGRLGDGTTDNKTLPVQITPKGKPNIISVPEYMLYKFNKPKVSNIYQKGMSLPIEWELISRPVESFDIYYAPYEGWTDESTWTVIEENVPVSSLSPTPYVSDISDGKGGFLEGIRYRYNWVLPNEFIPHIRIIAVPKYE